MPRPKKKRGEKRSSYRQRLVRHYINEGYPKRQAVAIAYSVERKTRKKRKTARRGNR